MSEMSGNCLFRDKLLCCRLTAETKIESSIVNHKTLPTSQNTTYSSRCSSTPLGLLKGLKKVIKTQYKC